MVEYLFLDGSLLSKCKISGIWTYNRSKFVQYFNQQNYNNNVYDYESFTKPKFDAKNASTVKSTT